MNYGNFLSLWLKKIQAFVFRGRKAEENPIDPKFLIHNSQLSFRRSLRLNASGFTLVEMLVVLAILAILAAVTVPYAEVTVRRNKELDLREDLREMRSAIDHFHNDWVNGVISKYSDSVSDDGYPKTLAVLVKGVDQTGPQAVKQKYLRHVPENPFGDSSLPPEQQWGLHSYADEADAAQWGGQDVWDVYCSGDGKALDGSYYHDW